MSLSQNVTLKSDRNIDVIGYYVYNNNITIVIFSYINGKLLAKHQQISDIYGDVSETTTNYLNQFYFKSFNLPKKCFVNLDSNTLKLLSSINKISFINPITGKYRSILQTVANNAKTYYQSNYLVFKKHQKTNELAFKELKDILSIDNLSLINVFDMSNLFGSDKVGAMIALENGQFNKQLYRKFIIKDINANTDSQYMYEVIKRQYSKVIKDEGTLPNLIMVDGGLIQINVTIKALSEIHLDKIIPVIGLVKNNQHKTRGIIFSNKKEIFLDPKSSLYMYLFNIQEEVHRYAISFFKKRNINSMFKSRLNDIKGLGDKSIKKLLGHYDNIANIKKASIEDLSQYVSKDIAIKIHRSFN
jgi:excinuclease ABC subunit C